jgi:hypothetical protein
MKTFKIVHLPALLISFLLGVTGCTYSQLGNQAGRTQQSNQPTVLVNDQYSFPIENRSVGNCTQMVPVGWQASSNKEGNALDLWDNNKTMYAGYVMLPVNTRMAIFYDKELYNKVPERSILRIMGVVTAGTFQDNAPQFTDEINEEINGYKLRSFESNNCKGVVLYRIFPGDGFNYTYIEGMRMAITRKNIWEQKGELVAGIAFRIMCQGVVVQHDSPTFPRSSSLKSSSTRTKKDDYGYNPQRGTEECHNPRTGQNYIVTPDMWSNTGPDGPGYYGPSGNERIKMSPGRSN